MVPADRPHSRRQGRRANVLLLAPYPHGHAPSQRFRFEQYLEPLAELGYRIDVRSLLDERAHAALHRPGGTRVKAIALLRGAMRRVAEVTRARRYDFAFVHREALPLGPPVVERVLARLGVPFLYDFDDAVYLPNVSDANRRLARLKLPGKTATVASLAALVSAGNDDLADWVRPHNREVIVVPTTIDTELYRPPPPSAPEDEVCIGWSGSVTTTKHLDAIAGVLADLQRRHGIHLRVIGDVGYTVPGARVDALPWRAETEIADLSRLDIGVMPIPDDEWGRGKCGLKALQYMALGIPTVMSPVGVNRSIAADGAALLAADLEDWRAALERLIADPAEREAVGERGRRRVEERYSVRAVLPLYTEAMERMTLAAARRS